jgi:spermidine/putrescine transport system ATP-binding protein
MLQVETERGLRILVKPTESFNGSTPHQVVVSVRPEKIQLSLEKPSSSINCFEGRLMHTMYLGTHVHYLVELLSGDRLTVLQPNRAKLAAEPDSPLYIYWAETDCLALTA